jgi:hypothetical protein
MDEVIETALGTPLPQLRGACLSIRWSLSKQTMGRWLHTGRVRGEFQDHCMFLERTSLAQLLRDTVMGGDRNSYRTTFAPPTSTVFNHNPAGAKLLAR